MVLAHSEIHITLEKEKTITHIYRYLHTHTPAAQTNQPKQRKNRNKLTQTNQTNNQTKQNPTKPKKINSSDLNWNLGF